MTEDEAKTKFRVRRRRGIGEAAMIRIPYDVGLFIAFTTGVLSATLAQMIDALIR